MASLLIVVRESIKPIRTVARLVITLILNPENIACEMPSARFFASASKNGALPTIPDAITEVALLHNHVNLLGFASVVPLKDGETLDLAQQKRDQRLEALPLLICGPV